ncbi:MAG TPA: alpha-amylase family glycosyl hydrolase [Pyrinomonadaceae bacterium]|nr:alpha-amylase family glycosyl hydrolase [Pyrinomonadaceae bacterium]
MKNKLNLCLFLLFFAFCSFVSVKAQPSVEKVEPPSWWTNSNVSPVRVLLTGQNLRFAKMVIRTNSPNLTATNYKSSENGHYLFFDLKIAPNTKPGKYKIQVYGAPPEKAEFDFEILAKSKSPLTHRGFTPDDVIYFLMPDRFSDGDVSNNDPAKSKGLYDRAKGRHYHGGDLQGIINKLSYLKSLGVTAIWTTPIYDNNDKPDTKEVYPGVPETTGYHGYGATDMYAVDEHLGDMAKLKEFVQTAQKMGFKVIQDQVANHTGPYHRWADDPPTPTWWNGTVKDHPNNNWQKWTAMNPRATYQTQSRNIDGWFINILPDFNQADAEVEKYLIQNTLWWVETVGFDAIRMDTLPHVPRAFWEKWGTAIKKEFPKVNVLGELYDGDPALIAYFQAGRKGHDGIDPKIDTLYDYALFYPIRNAFAKGESIRGVSQMLAHDWLYPNPNVLTTFIGLHDMERFMYEKGATIEGLKLAQTFIMTTRGTPLLYYGDEIAMNGGSDPDNRKDFPGGFAGDKRNAFEANGRTKEENDVWNHLAKLGALRQEYEALRKGETLDLLDEEQQMAFVRFQHHNPFKDPKPNPVIVVFNNDKKAADVEFRITNNGLTVNGAIENYTWANAQDINKLWLYDKQIFTDRLGNLGSVKIENGMFKLKMPARSAGIFTVK